jgi:hypothetical protein
MEKGEYWWCSGRDVYDNAVARRELVVPKPGAGVGVKGGKVEEDTVLAEHGLPECVLGHGRQSVNE